MRHAIQALQTRFIRCLGATSDTALSNVSAAWVDRHRWNRLLPNGAKQIFIGRHGASRISADLAARHSSSLHALAGHMHMISLKGLRHSWAFAIALATWLVPGLVRAQAGTSYSQAAGFTTAPLSNPCNEFVGRSAATSAACGTVPIGNGSGVAGSSSNNAARTASAAASLRGSAYGYVLGASMQNGVLDIVGTPSAGSLLVFHYLTTQSTSTFDVTPGSRVEWMLQGTGGQADQNYYGGVVTAPGLSGGATRTAGGYDFTAPLGAEGAFAYYFYVYTIAASVSEPLPSDARIDASLTATLSGVDVESADGAFIGSASFDAQTGAGGIDLTAVAAPEPASLVLLATGLTVVLASTGRRRIRR